MRNQKDTNKKNVNKIIFTIFRWIAISMWIFLIWTGFDFAIKLLCTLIIISIESLLIYDNVKKKNNIWG